MYVRVFLSTPVTPYDIIAPLSFKCFEFFSLFSLQPNVFTIPKESKYLYLKIDLIWKEPSAIWLSVLSKVSVKSGFCPKEVKLSSNGIVFVSCTEFKKGFPNTVSANEY